MTEHAHRLNGHELARLAAGDAALAARLEHADDIRAVKLALATESLAESLARDVARLQQGSLADRLMAWWQGAGMPTTVAAAAITAIAVGAIRLQPPELTPAPGLASGVDTDAMFVAAFEPGDSMFGGEFEPKADDRLFTGSFDG